jgi:hypothetical protein
VTSTGRASPLRPAARLAAGRDDPAVADHDQVVGDDLDLVQQVRGQQDGAALAGEARQQVAHPPDPGRVEPVGRFVEDQHPGVPEQRGADAQSLAHAEGVVAHAALGLRRCQADELEHLVDAAARQAHGVGGDREDLASGAAGVLGGGVQQDAHLEAGVGEVGEPFSVMVAAAGRRDGQADHHAHRGGLPAPFGPRKPVTRPGRAVKETSSTAVKPAYLRVSDSTVIM